MTLYGHKIVTSQTTVVQQKVMVCSGVTTEKQLHVLLDVELKHKFDQWSHFIDYVSHIVFDVENDGVKKIYRFHYFEVMADANQEICGIQFLILDFEWSEWSVI